MLISFILVLALMLFRVIFSPFSVKLNSTVIAWPNRVKLAVILTSLLFLTISASFNSSIITLVSIKEPIDESLLFIIDVKSLILILSFIEL